MTFNVVVRLNKRLNHLISVVSQTKFTLLVSSNNNVMIRLLKIKHPPCGPCETLLINHLLE